ncbi:META domain-containing protein [Winogradskyella endarachnes]|uniref:META domain-containing protein n=1 Tax=Winogradskyella endarachnes TaxID=2681965 RepID=A0A6L6UBV8_9FLAO|nr:META domain-containing protein [Winogradskyella endarachnes]MUU79825.1 META domain-containing protein [Winogradskyella endarachnes]
MKILLSLFMLLTTMSSCDSSKKAMENSKKMEDSLSGTYYITEVEDMDVSSNKITITFDIATNKVTGFAGCNSFFGNYTLEKSTLTFQNIGASKKFCAGTASKTERQFLKALNSIDSFSISDNLISFSAENSVVLKGTSEMILNSKKSELTTYKDNTTIKYQATSRASFEYITISKSEIIISEDKTLLKTDKFKTNLKDWEELNKLISTIDPETIHNLTPPSTAHKFDGAPHATLAIILGDVQYMTPTFDHGNPPETIKTLVNKVLSIKENTVRK